MLSIINIWKLNQIDKSKNQDYLVMDLDFPLEGAVKVSMIKYVKKSWTPFQNKFILPSIFQQRITYLVSGKKMIPWSYQSYKLYNSIKW